MKRGKDQIEIRGVVLDHITKEPLNRALVLLKSMEGKVVEEINTGEEGRFYIVSSNAESYSISADYKGSISEIYQVSKNQKSMF